MKRTLSGILALILSLSLTACGGDGGKAPLPSAEAMTWQEQYDLGLRYLSEGNYEEAILAFTAAIEIDPKRAPAYAGRGDAYVLSGKSGEKLSAALSDYTAALELDASAADVYAKLADVYLAMGDMDAAVETLRQGYELTQAEALRERLDELVPPESEEPGSSELPRLYGEVSNVQVSPPMEGHNEGSVGMLNFEFAWDTASVPQELDGTLCDAYIATWAPDGFSDEEIYEQAAFYEELWKQDDPAGKRYPAFIGAGFPIWEEDRGTVQQVLMYALNASWEVVGYILVPIEIPT